MRLGHPMIEPIARAHLTRASSRIGASVEPPSLEEIDQKPTRALIMYLVADAQAGRESSAVAAEQLEQAGELAGELGFVALERSAFERAADVWGAFGNEENRLRALQRAAVAMASLEAHLPTDLREAFVNHPRNESLRSMVHA